MVMLVNTHAHVPWLSYVEGRGQPRSWFSPLPALESRLTRPGLYTKCSSLSRLACLTMSFVVVAIFIIVINVTVDFMVIRFVSNHLNICLNFRWNTCNLQISGFFNFIFSLCVFFCLWYSCKSCPNPIWFCFRSTKGGRRKKKPHSLAKLPVWRSPGCPGLETQKWGRARVEPGKDSWDNSRRGGLLHNSTQETTLPHSNALRASSQRQSSLGFTCLKTKPESSRFIKCIQN